MLFRSGWLRYLMGIDDEGKQFELSPDPLLQEVCPFVADFRLGEACGPEKTGMQGEEAGLEEVEEKLKPLLENEKIFGVNLYEAGLAQRVCRYFTEMLNEPGAVRQCLKNHI